MVQDAVDFNDTHSPEIRDERGHLSAELLSSVEAALAQGLTKWIRNLAAELHEADNGDLIEALDPDQRAEFIRLAGKQFDFTTLTELEDSTRARVIDSLQPEDLAEGVREMDSDDVVSLLEDLPAEDREDILARIPVEERRNLVAGLEFPEDSAGRRMQTEVIGVPPFWNVGRTIDYMRDDDDLPDEFYELFVVDAAFRPVGTVALSRLMRTKRPVVIADIANSDVRVVHANDDQEDVARLFARYNLVSCPVVDDSERLVGVITVDDIVDVIQVEADEDIKALAGVASDEDLSDNFWTIARGRFSWLLVNLGTAVAASVVIGLFAGQLQQMVALAILMPIVASQGGNAGIQSMTVTVRAISTLDLGPHNMSRVIGRELMAGMVNGLAFAVIIGSIAALWFQEFDLGLVIGLAMLINLVVAAAAGVIVPIALNRFHADPAVSSSTFVTTVTDIVGFVSFLGLAGWWFSLG
jgi:magnesium transporter